MTHMPSRDGPDPGPWPEDDRSAMATTIAIGIISFIAALLFFHFVARPPGHPKQAPRIEQSALIAPAGRTESPRQLIAT